MPDSEFNLKFPVKGLEVTRECQLQPPDTTARAVNVRAKDSIALRTRGGSRPGLSKYVAQQLPGWVAGEPVQHLQIIVDPTTDALTQNFDTPDGTWVEHPRFPGVYVPPGGGGNQPNPNADQDDPPSVALDFEQSFVDEFALTTTEVTANFDTTPGNNSLCLVCVVSEDVVVAGNATVAVTNANGDAYTQVGAYVRNTKIGTQFSMSVWRRVASQGAAEIGVKVTPSAEVTLAVAGMEWSGPNATPTDSTSTNSGNSASPSTGNVAVDLGTEAVVGFFAGVLAVDTVTPSAGYTLAVDLQGGGVSGILLYGTYRKLAPVGNENPSVTWAGGADDFVAFGVELKD